MSRVELGDAMPPSSEADWLKAVDAALRGKSADTLVSHDLGGFTRQPLYTENAQQTGQDDSGLPGFAPFTRGARVLNNQFLPWHIAQRLTPGRKGHDNTAALSDLQGGVSALMIDLSEGLVTCDALDSLLDGVMLDIAPLSLQPGPHAMAAAEVLIELREKRNVDAQTDGYLNLDPLSASLRYGTEDTLDMAALVARTKYQSGLRLLTASGACWHDMGASVVQELAWVTASLTEYLRRFDAAGVAPAQAIGKITLSLASDGDFFASLSKIRAARALFANVAAGLGLDAVPEIHVETSQRDMSNLDPWVNILRATVSSMAAGIAGVDMMSVAPCTATSMSDNELTRRIARNTQIILQEESHIGHVADAAGGSWYVEALTQDLAKQAWAVFQQIEASGGLAAALAKGEMRSDIETQRTAYHQAVDVRVKPLVGVSEFPNIDEAPLNERPQSNAQGLGAYRLAEGFEALRVAAQKSKPKVFMACLGETASFTPRLNFAANLYAAGGLHAVNGAGGTDIDAIVQAFSQSNAKIAVICGSDGDYDTHAAALAKALHAAGTQHLALAGKARDIDEIDDYCFAGGAALTLLTRIHEKMGL
jgi:methylmalonyl-CoA mutase